MSEENLEVVRTGYDAWNRSDLDGLLGTLAPDLEFVTSGVFPGLDPVYRGHDGFKRLWRDFRGTWRSLQLSIDQLRDCDDRVIALVTFEARGRDGMEVRRKTGTIHTFRNGRAVRVVSYEGWAEALEAAGLQD